LLTAEKPTAIEGDTKLTNDPLKPMQIPGLSFPGARDARAFEKQSEVRTFTTPPLTEPVEWTGRVRAELQVSSTAKDTDFIVRVSDVYPDGRSILLVDYPIRARYREGFEKEVLLTPGEVATLAFDVGWVSQIFAAGHRIRVTVASSGAPLYEPNPQTGEPFTIIFPKDVVAAVNRIHPDFAIGRDREIEFAVVGTRHEEVVGDGGRVLHDQRIPHAGRRDPWCEHAARLVDRDVHRFAGRVRRVNVRGRERGLGIGVARPQPDDDVLDAHVIRIDEDRLVKDWALRQATGHIDVEFRTLGNSLVPREDDLAFDRGPLGAGGGGEGREREKAAGQCERAEGQHENGYLEEAGPQMEKRVQRQRDVFRFC
jgi:hypothetical protein